MMFTKKPSPTSSSATAQRAGAFDSLEAAIDAHDRLFA